MGWKWDKLSVTVTPVDGSTAEIVVWGDGTELERATVEQKHAAQKVQQLLDGYMK